MTIILPDIGLIYSLLSAKCIDLSLLIDYSRYFKEVILSNIGRYKGYPRGFMAVSQTTFSTKPPKSHDNLKVDLKVTVMLNY